MRHYRPLNRQDIRNTTIFNRTPRTALFKVRGPVWLGKRDRARGVVILFQTTLIANSGQTSAQYPQSKHFDSSSVGFLRFLGESAS